MDRPGYPVDGLVEPGKGFYWNGLSPWRLKSLRRFHGWFQNLPPAGRTHRREEASGGFDDAVREGRTSVGGHRVEGIRGGKGTVATPFDQGSRPRATGKSCDA